MHLVLVAEVTCKVLNKLFRLCNVYGPYTNQGLYWDQSLENKVFLSNNTIIRGDLNFSMGRGEIWRDLAREDPLTRYFCDKLELVGLLDVEPSMLYPTWTNNRLGSMTIHKHLDRFLVH
jgi:hypothetical protein